MIFLIKKIFVIEVVVHMARKIIISIVEVENSSNSTLLIRNVSRLAGSYSRLTHEIFLRLPIHSVSVSTENSTL